MRTIVILMVISVLAIVGLASMRQTVAPKKGPRKVAAPTGPRIAVRRERVVRFDLSNANYRLVEAPRRRNVVSTDPFYRRPKNRGGPFELQVPQETLLKVPKRIDSKEEKNRGQGGATPGVE